MHADTNSRFGLSRDENRWKSAHTVNVRKRSITIVARVRPNRRPCPRRRGKRWKRSFSYVCWSCRALRNASVQGRRSYPTGNPLPGRRRHQDLLSRRAFSSQFRGRIRARLLILRSRPARFHHTPPPPSSPPPSSPPPPPPPSPPPPPPPPPLLPRPGYRSFVKRITKPEEKGDRERERQRERREASGRRREKQRWSAASQEIVRQRYAVEIRCSSTSSGSSQGVDDDEAAGGVPSRERRSQTARQPGERGKGRGSLSVEDTQQ